MSTRCADGRHYVRVLPYLLGQYRIQILDSRQPSIGGDAIVREMCTYRVETMVMVTGKLLESVSPLAIAESYARPWNCEHPGGRIRLDNQKRLYDLWEG